MFFVVQVIKPDAQSSSMSEGIADRIHHLVEALNRLELQIAGETEALIDQSCFGPLGVTLSDLEVRDEQTGPGALSMICR